MHSQCIDGTPTRRSGPPQRLVAHAGTPVHAAGAELCKYATTASAEAGPATTAHGDDTMIPAVRRRRAKTWDDSQPDLFIALPSDIPARDQQDLMERPFFSLSKNRRTTPIEYKVGENYIKVTAPVDARFAHFYQGFKNL